MSLSEEEFLAELRKAFAVEAAEHLQTIASGLVEIEKLPDAAGRQAVTEAVFRAAHSLKGAARSVNLADIGAVCQSVESVFSAMKKGQLTLAAADFDVLLQAMDSLAAMLASPTGEGGPEVLELIGRLDRIAAPPAAPGARPAAQKSKAGPARRPPSPVGAIPAPSAEAQEKTPPPPPAASPASPAGKPAPETIRIATGKLDVIMLQAEELIAIKLAAEQRIAELEDTLALLGVWKKDRKDGLARGAAPGTGDEKAGQLHDLELRLNALLVALRADRRSSGMQVDQLREDAKAVLLQPFSTLLQSFPKMVRDISREQGKEVNLVLAGGETEIDKRILEGMKDPLIHLLRNSIDHGLETPAARLAAGKPAAGQITVEISQADGNRIQILVSDDGEGINSAKLRAAAVQREILSASEASALDEQAALMLIFQSGISTSPIITDLSGRGLGMAIVQEAVDKLGGRILLETRPGHGTVFRISLPLTLATFRGMLLQEEGQLFVVPTLSVERVLRIRKEEIRSVENRQTILMGSEPLPLARLGQVLGLPPVAGRPEAPPLVSVIVLNSGRQRLAFAVDRILHEQEILIKGLGRQLVRIRNVAGATILGSGKVVLVLNVADLARSVVRAGRTGGAALPAAKEENARRQAILVVDDSITSRMLIKNILVSAGFAVETAVDGIDAWTRLGEKPFDVVVSDIEMPRLNGLDLTARIRDNARFAELPVVLVTSLESRADRERGIEVGANAYIVKSSFDQSNLLETVRRLI